MKKMDCRPFEPYVSMEEVYAYRREDVATHTRSPLVDAVLDCFAVPELRTGRAMGRFLRLDERMISHYLQIATGHGLNELRRLWTINRAERYMQEHPKCGEEELARVLGYRDRSSLWQAMNAERINRKRQRERDEINAHVRELNRKFYEEYYKNKK